MKKLFLAVLLATVVVSAVARGGFSSGGGRGGFSSARSYSSPSFSSTRAPTITANRSVTTTTTVSRSTGSYGPAVSYGGMGSGYHYSNGLLTGMVIGNMLHPPNTVVYAGPGMYANNALLYPNGQVVNNTGQVVGTYTNNVFTPVANGPVVAQQIPATVVEDTTDAILLSILGGALIICLAILIALMLV